jgi:hypothetical protein
MAGAMTAHAVQLQAEVDIVAVFKARCWARARLFSECELDLHDAVDALQEAVSTGLVAAIGQDAVQAMMAEAFGAVRAKPTAWDLGDEPGSSRHQGTTPPDALAEALDYVRAHFTDRSRPAAERLRKLWTGVVAGRDLAAANTLKQAFQELARQVSLDRDLGRHAQQDLEHVIRWGLLGRNPFGSGQ